MGSRCVFGFTRKDASTDAAEGSEQALAPRQRRTRRAVTRATVVTALVFTAAGCADEPTREPLIGSQSAVRVVIDDASPSQSLVSELYLKALNAHGRTSVPYRPDESDPDAPRIQALTSGDADVVIGCMGELLEELNPPEAARLSEEYSAAVAAGDVNVNDGSWREEVYSALVNSLPGTLAATDPSNATACQDSTPPLPENIVPIYRKPVLNREARLVLNKVTGTISTADIDELTEEFESTGSVSQVLGPYMSKNDLQG